MRFLRLASVALILSLVALSASAQSKEYEPTIDEAWEAYFSQDLTNDELISLMTRSSNIPDSYKNSVLQRFLSSEHSFNETLMLFQRWSFDDSILYNVFSEVAAGLSNSELSQNYHSESEHGGEENAINHMIAAEIWLREPSIADLEDIAIYDPCTSEEAIRVILSRVGKLRLITLDKLIFQKRDKSSRECELVLNGVYLNPAGHSVGDTLETIIKFGPEKYARQAFKRLFGVISREYLNKLPKQSLLTIIKAFSVRDGLN